MATAVSVKYQSQFQAQPSGAPPEYVPGTAQPGFVTGPGAPPSFAPHSDNMQQQPQQQQQQVY